MSRINRHVEAQLELTVVTSFFLCGSTSTDNQEVVDCERTRTRPTCHAEERVSCAP